MRQYLGLATAALDGMFLAQNWRMRPALMPTINSDEQEHLHYVYELVNPINNVVFYIGQGKRNRKIKRERYEDHLVEAGLYAAGRRWRSLNRRKLETIVEILEHGELPRINILFTASERSAADRAEIEWIANIGRIDLGTGTLTNMTSGGTGGAISYPKLSRSAKSAALKAAYARLSPERLRSNAMARGQGSKAYWASLDPIEKRQKVDKLQSGDVHKVDRLRENGFYWNDSQREARIPKLRDAANAQWAAMSALEKEEHARKTSDAHNSRTVEETAAIREKSSRSLKARHAADPFLILKSHTEEVRQKRGKAISAGWARRNATITDEARLALRLSRQASGRKSGETRRKKRDKKQNEDPNG